MHSRTAVLDLERVAGVFQALSDATRLQVVDMLRGGERCVCELTDALDASQSRLSFHLRVLKEAGLVLDRREGRWIYYRLNQERVEAVASVLTDCCMPSKRWLTGGCCG